MALHETIQEFPADICMTTSRLRLENAVGEQTSVFTFHRQTQVFSGQKWVLEIDFLPVEREEFAALEAFLLSLRGKAGQFRMGDPHESQPLGVASGSPVVDSASAGDESFTVTGFTPNVSGQLKAGDKVEICGNLHCVLSDVDSDSSGNATILVAPALRKDYTQGDTLITSNARGVFALMEEPTFSRDLNSIRRTSIRLVENPHAVVVCAEPPPLISLYMDGGRRQGEFNVTSTSPYTYQGDIRLLGNVLSTYPTDLNDSVELSNVTITQVDQANDIWEIARSDGLVLFEGTGGASFVHLNTWTRAATNVFADRYRGTEIYEGGITYQNPLKVTANLDGGVHKVVFDISDSSNVAQYDEIGPFSGKVTAQLKYSADGVLYNGTTYYGWMLYGETLFAGQSMISNIDQILMVGSGERLDNVSWSPLTPLQVGSNPFSSMAIETGATADILIAVVETNAQGSGTTEFSLIDSSPSRMKSTIQGLLLDPSQNGGFISYFAGNWYYSSSESTAMTASIQLVGDPYASLSELDDRNRQLIIRSDYFAEYSDEHGKDGRWKDDFEIEINIPGSPDNGIYDSSNLNDFSFNFSDATYFGLPTGNTYQLIYNVGSPSEWFLLDSDDEESNYITTNPIHPTNDILPMTFSMLGGTVEIRRKP